MRRVRTHTNPLNINHRFDDVVLPENPVALDIEIGFGKGVFLNHWATQNPQHHVVGIEVRKQMVVLLEEKLTLNPCSNISIYHGNGQFFLEDVPEDNSVDRLFIFHPDPWFKKRHHKRRVITEPFIHLIAKKLKPQGKLYLSTDVEPLFIDMNDQLTNTRLFKAVEDTFWQTMYKTHWGEFSKENNRATFKQAYQRN